jgi:hypothetical protein
MAACNGSWTPPGGFRCHTCAPTNMTTNRRDVSSFAEDQPLPEGCALPRASPQLPQATGLFDIRPTPPDASVGQGQVTPFCLGPTSVRDPGHCRRGEEKCGRPPESRCCCSNSLDCSCCGRTGGHSSDYCSTTRPPPHGLLMTCPRIQGEAPVMPKPEIAASRRAADPPRSPSQRRADTDAG